MRHREPPVSAPSDTPSVRRSHEVPLVGLVVALLIAIATTLGCDRVGQGAPAEDRVGPPPAVEAVPARFGVVPLEERVSGVVKARNQVAIRPEIEGQIVEVLVRNGDAVDSGDPLVRLQTDTQRDQLQQAEANLRLEEARLAELRARVVRTRSLAAEGLVSEMDLETQEAQLVAAEASVDQARAVLQERRSAIARTTVRAPVSGRVGQRSAEVGMVVDPSNVLFVVGDLDELIVEVPLTDEMLAKVQEGQPVRIRAAAANQPIEASLSRVSPFLEESSFSTVGEIDLRNPDDLLRPGMFVTVDLLYGQSERATLIPASAVWDDPGDGRRGAFVVEDAEGLDESGSGTSEVPSEPRRVAFRSLDLLAAGGGTVGVRGVSEGEWVITLGQHLLREASQGLDADPATELLARVRATSWERVLRLQGLQREDLLTDFLEKQRRIAEAIGAEIPESEEVVHQILAHEPTAGTGDGASARTGAAGETTGRN